MKALHHTSFWESLAIQRRVIGALLMREIITRYGRNNIGFLWLFVEPLLMTLLIVSLWGYIRANQVSSLNMFAFVMTGYPMMMMWRSASSRAIGAIGANISLLYHRNVRVLDTLFARMLLEIAGASIAQVVIVGLFVAMSWIAPPSDVFYMLMAWFLMAMFAIGLGLVICSVAYKFEAFLFDAFESLDDMAILRVKREEEFAPVKNAEGVDSPETARELYINFHKKN